MNTDLPFAEKTEFLCCRSREIDERRFAFAGAIVDLLEKPQIRREMGESGYRRCIEEFSLERSLNKVHDLYLELTVIKGSKDGLRSNIHHVSR